MGVLETLAACGHDRLEIADVYKTSALKVLARLDQAAGESPPYLGVPPALEVYRKPRHALQ